MVHSRLAMQKDFCSESPGSNFGDPGFADTPEFGLNGWGLPDFGNLQFRHR
jgi:hypothetical protein